jgi:NADPH:quinone reductase-like Zn-dependent oxidoreductase
MKAVVCPKYGPAEVLRLVDVEKPVPRDDEVRIRVHATTVNRTDWGFRQPKPFFVRLVNGLFRPKTKILGSEVAGEVESVGAAVTQFQVGDPVFGIHPWKFGAHAEFVCMKESAPLAHKPAALPFEEAAAICDGGCLALLSLRAAKLQKRQSIAIYGASGSIGTAAVQLAKHFEAQVTAVCGTKNLALMKTLGADAVVDYTREDFTKNGHSFDVILDAVDKHSFWRCRGSLKPGGVYVATDGFSNLLLAGATALFGRRRVALLVATGYSKTDVLLLKRLAETGQYRPVIDRRYPLDEVVAATKYVETEQKTGNVVLTVGTSL